MKPEAMRSEKDVKAAIKKMLDELEAWHYMHVPIGYGRAGIPDHTACVNGTFVGIEAKFGSRKTSPHQLKELNNVASAGGYAFIVNQWGLEELEYLLGRIKLGGQHKPYQDFGRAPSFFDLRYPKPKEHYRR